MSGIPRRPLGPSQAPTGDLRFTHWGPGVHSLGSWGSLTGSLPGPHWVPQGTTCPSMAPTGSPRRPLGPSLAPTGDLRFTHWGPGVHSLGSWGSLTGSLPGPHWVPQGTTCPSMAPTGSPRRPLGSSLAPTGIPRCSVRELWAITQVNYMHLRYLRSINDVHRGKIE